MKLFIVGCFVVVALLVGATAATAETGSSVETLKPSTALAEVKASSGIVFVDLYADW